jgi:hypothetical protein
MSIILNKELKKRSPRKDSHVYKNQNAEGAEAPTYSSTLAAGFR